MTLAQEAERLCNIHQDHSSQIQAKNAEISSNWESLKSKVITEYSCLPIRYFVC